MNPSRTLRTNPSRTSSCLPPCSRCFLQQQAPNAYGPCHSSRSVPTFTVYLPVYSVPAESKELLFSKARLFTGAWHPVERTAQQSNFLWSVTPTLHQEMTSLSPKHSMKRKGKKLSYEQTCEVEEGKVEHFWQFSGPKLQRLGYAYPVTVCIQVYQ